MVIPQHELATKKISSRPSKLSVEDTMLMRSPPYAGHWCYMLLPNPHMVIFHVAKQQVSFHSLNASTGFLLLCSIVPQGASRLVQYPYTARRSRNPPKACIRNAPRQQPRLFLEENVATEPLRNGMISLRCDGLISCLTRPTFPRAMEKREGAEMSDRGLAADFGDGARRSEDTTLFLLCCRKIFCQVLLKNLLFGNHHHTRLR